MLDELELALLPDADRWQLSKAANESWRRNMGGDANDQADWEWLCLTDKYCPHLELTHVGSCKVCGDNGG